MDDEKNILSILRDFLSYEGFHVNTAVNGTECLNLVETCLYDIVITDQNMPDIQGLEIARKIKEKSPETVIIMLTGGENSLKDFNKDKHLFHSIIYKPVNLQNLLHHIHTILHTRKT